MVLRNEELPFPPSHVPKAKWDIWYDYWRKIYLDAEDTQREVEHNERMANGSGSWTEMETD